VAAVTVVSTLAFAGTLFFMFMAAAAALAASRPADIYQLIQHARQGVHRFDNLCCVIADIAAGQGFKPCPSRPIS
jgi:hypothetical protein